MSNQVYYSDRETDSVADILKAVGAAECFRAWLQARGRPAYPIMLREQSNCYHIELPSSLDEGDIAAVQTPFSPGPGRLLLKNAKRVGEQRGASETSSTEREPLQNVLAFPERIQDRSVMPPKSGEAEGPGDDQEDATSLELDLSLSACLNQFRATESYYRLWQQWHTEHIESFRTTLRVFLALFRQSPNPTVTLIKRWTSLARQKEVTGPALANRLQLVNPSAGKGGNTPKIDTLHEDNLQGFWLAEYLKFVGFFTLAIPARLKKSKDRQIYVLHPSSGDLSTLQNMGHDMRRALQPYTTTASDVLALLQLAHQLVEQMKEACTASLSRPGEMPRDTTALDLPLIGSRLEVAYYKNMGSAYAIMHLATLRHPFWIRSFKTVDEVDRVHSILKEHLAIMKHLREREHEEAKERALLAQYREFLSGHDPHLFLNFAGAYGSYALIRHRHGQHLPLLSKATLEYIMTQAAKQKHWGEIFENEGFEAVAAAIRRATIGAQYWAAREPGYPYEVRYGLGQELLGVADDPREFIKHLSIFLQSYNMENARIDERMIKHPISERPHYRRPSIRKEQEQALFRLFDEFSPELISTMLVSYGYMRDGQVFEGAPSTLTAESASESEQAPILFAAEGREESDDTQITAFSKAAVDEQEGIA